MDDKLHINFDKFGGIYSVKLFDLLGNQVYSEQIVNYGKPHIIDISILPEGAYYLSVQTINSIDGKVVIKKK